MFFTVRFARLENYPRITFKYIFQILRAALAFACSIGLCAHGSLLARGRSSARTTYFPVWILGSDGRPLLVKIHSFLNKKTAYKNIEAQIAEFES